MIKQNLVQILSVGFDQIRQEQTMSGHLEGPLITDN